MPLVACPACGAPVSPSARTCPRCGHELKPSLANLDKRRRTGTFLLGLVLVAIIVGVIWASGSG